MLENPVKIDLFATEFRLSDKNKNDIAVFGNTSAIYCREIKEAFEKYWAHSPQRAASRPFTRCR